MEGGRDIIRNNMQVLTHRFHFVKDTMKFQYLDPLLGIKIKIFQNGRDSIICMKFK